MQPLLLRHIHGGARHRKHLLPTKRKNASSWGIRFEDEIRALPDPAVMQEIDMISYGEFTDNAIEACQSQRSGNRTCGFPA